MEVIIRPNADDASIIGARIVARLMRENPNTVLGLATGSTPVGLYNELIRMHREDGLDLSTVRTFNLDEYVGLPPDHPQSYRRFMDENLFRWIGIPFTNIHFPDGMAANIPASCMRYEEEIRGAGGIDIQILGIGSDGHIAFNSK
jgi:glucosamine-6-phosphate deaminase